MKKLLVFLLVVVMAVSFIACGKSGAAPTAIDAHSLDAIKEIGEIIVATESQFAPFCFKDEKGNIVGLEPAFMQKIADDLGVKLTIMDVEFTAVTPAVQSGMADIALAGLNPTAERKETLEMSDVYQGGEQCVLVLKGSEGKADFKAIACQKGALQQTIGEEQFSTAKLTLLSKVPQCIQELVVGNVEGVIVDKFIAEQYIKQNSDLAISNLKVELDPAEVGFSVAVMKGNSELLNYINEEIAKYQASGELATWFDDASALAETLGV